MNLSSGMAQFVALASTSALTAVFYSIYRNRATIADRLKEATKVSIDQDLKQILAETPAGCVPYAVVEGPVKAAEETLNSQFVDNCEGVIQRLTLTESKRARYTRLWRDTEKVIHQHTNSVPFAIGSLDENVFVRVECPLEVKLETTYQRFHPKSKDLITGERLKGILETEAMLQVGGSLTGVGKLVLDNNVIKLLPPKEDYSYFLGHLDYDTLLRKEESRVQFLKFIAILLGVAECSTLVYILRKKYAHYRQSERNQRAMDEFNERQRQRSQGQESDESNGLPSDESNVSPAACTVCLSRGRDCVFLECGHVCACLQCYRALPQPKKCPVCRGLIARAVQLFHC
ncbi:mitochondrial ubiquitin ligase activator of NFKB 1-like [Eucyclogobius newberryi]|uniref:mitochondrial ubiquitin ligase activator of NFKB 1-like n=1 Tax=Eucyclogobius newberryi TaxID=166745 RepID=UPI003B5C4288